MPLVDQFKRQEQIKECVNGANDLLESLETLKPLVNIIVQIINPINNQNLPSHD
jgi:hypothetical protein